MVCICGFPFEKIVGRFKLVMAASQETLTSFAPTASVSHSQSKPRHPYGLRIHAWVPCCTSMPPPTHPRAPPPHLHGRDSLPPQASAINATFPWEGLHTTTSQQCCRLSTWVVHVPSQAIAIAATSPHGRHHRTSMGDTRTVVPGMIERRRMDR
jgi:hypothetical protein